MKNRKKSKSKKPLKNVGIKINFYQAVGLAISALGILSIIRHKAEKKQIKKKKIILKKKK